MNSKNKIIIAAVVFVVLMAVAALGYSYLSSQYTPYTPPTSTGDNTVLKNATDFTAYDENGNEISLSDYFGKPIVLNFWATWCGPCKSEMPHFDELYGIYGDRVEFLMVNLTDGTRDTVASAKSFVAENGYGFPVYYDTSYNASAAYNTYSIPLSVFINSEGKITRTYRGSMPKSTLQKYIEEIL